MTSFTGLGLGCHVSGPSIISRQTIDTVSRSSKRQGGFDTTDVSSHVDNKSFVRSFEREREYCLTMNSQRRRRVVVCGTLYVVVVITAVLCRAVVALVSFHSYALPRIGLGTRQSSRTEFPYGRVRPVPILVRTSLTALGKVCRDPNVHDPAGKTGEHEHDEDDDRRAVLKQLGYLPANFVTVSARTVANIPIAIQTYPLGGGGFRSSNHRNFHRRVPTSRNQVTNRTYASPQDKDKQNMTPFPTLYWLTNPDISKAIADLERQGYVSVIDQQIRSNETLAITFLQRHIQYSHERWMSLSQHDQDVLTNISTDNTRDASSIRRIRQMLQYSGIAGTNITSLFANEEIRTILRDQYSHDTAMELPWDQLIMHMDPERLSIPSIKCLHAHYADYRSTIAKGTGTTSMWRNSNPVGKIVHELLQKESPDLIL